MRLSELTTGESAIIVKVHGHGAFRKRMLEMGFIRGRQIKVLLHAPLRDPIKYEIMGYEVALRTSEARMIEVVRLQDTDHRPDSVASDNAGIIGDSDYTPEYTEKRHTINVAFVGNPNCGKTSLFNVASGAREHVGNYSGVTIDAKYGHFTHAGYRFNIVDLPGTYSLTSYSPEELYVRRYLHDESPDVIVNVVDASNLERNLYLTTQLIDMDCPMVIALNMFDELRSSGAELDYESLAGMIGVPIVPTVSKTGEGVDSLFDTVIAVYEGRDERVRHIHVSLGNDIEAALMGVKNLLKADDRLDRHYSPRYLAIKLLEGDEEVEKLVSELPDGKRILSLRDKARARLNTIDPSGEDIAAQIANKKYGFIAGALAEVMKQPPQRTHDTTRIIDAFVTNKLFGFPLFFIIMFVMFWATFALGQYPMDWIDNGVSALSSLVNRLMPDGPLKDLIADGIIGGVGGVIVFLPNILILYFCISFMEDSGYMARAAFIMDKVMHRIGLHGKSFIPLVMGFGCNVPAIMGARAIESRTSRIITILINPFMSCSARLPIYVLLIGTFFSTAAAPWVFMGLYAAGILVAIITAKLMRRFKYRQDETPFVMELPPYRVPTFKALMRHMWSKGEQYLRKMGGIILVAAIIVWALNYFPRPAQGEHPAPVAVADDAAIDTSNDSFLEMAGKAINPVMEPLGFHWRASVAALAGVPAKEIVVSTLGVLYTNDEAVDDAKLSQRLVTPSPVTGKPDFSTASALAFMVFILLYCPCIATLTAIARECGSWKYAAFSALYNTGVAWIVSFIVYRVAMLC